MATSPGTPEPTTLPTPPIPRRVLAARSAVAVVFALHGLAVASWFARVPAVRDALGLAAGELGLLLMTMTGAAVLALLTAGAVTQRLGTARTATVSVIVSTAALALVGVAAETWTLVPAAAAGLFAFGYGNGTCHVAMNVEGAAVERLLRRTVMPRFHAAWSLGTVAGAALGAGFARAGLPLVLHLTLVTAVVLLGILIAVRSFLPAASDQAAGTADPGRGARRGAATGGSGLLAVWREPRTLLIGAVVLALAFAEGTANDWLAVAFVDGHGTTEAAGAAAFGVFVIAMTLGRTVGTVALDRWGRVAVLRATLLLAAAGAATAVLSGAWPLAYAGAALWGLGASLGVPVGMSAAADDERHAAARVSAVSAISYTAFLAGPPLLGFLGDRVGILRSLLVVPLVVLPALALVPAMRPPRSGRPTRR